MSWTLGLEYLKVLVWPVIACIAIILFRRPFHGLIGRISKVGAAGAEVEFSQAEEVLRQADETIEAIEEKVDEEPFDSDSSPNSQQADSESAVRNLGREASRVHLAEDARRSAIEQVLREGTRLGWEWARAGEEKPPDLDITWTPDGSPQIIKSGMGGRQRISHASFQRRYRQYEEQIALALKRTVPQALIERNAAINNREFDFVVSMNERKIAIEVKLLQRPGALLDQLENKFLRMTGGARNALGGLLVVVQEVPKMQVVGRLQEVGIDVVKWVDSSDDLSLRRSIERLAER